jgi:hypothetical protein
MQKGLKDKLRNYCIALGKDVKTVKTKKEFNENTWSENIRGIGTMLPNFKDELGLEEEYKQWKTISSGKFQVMTDEEVPQRFETLRPVLRSIVSKLV